MERSDDTAKRSSVKHSVPCVQQSLRPVDSTRPQVMFCTFLRISLWRSRMESLLQGGCLCGAIRYKAHGPGLGAFVCYCRMCPRASGSALMGFLYVQADSLQITKGSSKIFTSSPDVERSFCGRCGSPLFFRRYNRPGQCALATGSLDEPGQFAPLMRIFLSDRVSWLDGIHRIEGHAEKPAGMTPPIQYDPVTGIVDS
jgi:hypothetical protein